MVFQIKAMDNDQQDLQFLGFFGIFKESFKILLTWPKIFLQITLAFILPHSCLFLAQNLISKFLSSKIHHDKLSILPNNQVGSPNYTKISHTISSEVATLWIIKVVYLTFSLVLSLFAISAVVYTIACIYSGKNVTFRNVISVVPKVWKRLMITFLCNFCVMFAFFFAVILGVFILTMVVMLLMLIFQPKNVQIGIFININIIIMFIVMILFMVGFFYMAIIWQLANVISVMEKDCGFKALKKSKNLIKGKMRIAFGIFVVFGLFGYLLIEMIKKLGGVGILGKFAFGVPSVMLWALLNLVTLVVNAIFYLVCKSYHHESIDKSLLADHLDVYIGEYAPLKSEESIQLQHVHV